MKAYILDRYAKKAPLRFGERPDPGSDITAVVDQLVMRLDWAMDRPGIDRAEPALRTALRRRI